MKSLESYLSLLLRLPEGAEAAPCAVTLEELAGHLFCTPRNVKLLLKKWASDGWLTWQGGRGRGNRSQLQVHYPLHRAARDYLEGLLAADRIGEALRFYHGSDWPAGLREELQKEMQSRFGFQVERAAQETQDVLRLPMRRRLATLDPAHVAIAAETTILRSLCDSLVLYDAKQDRFEAHLAHAWDVCAEDRVWTFYLRKRVRFHHGKLLTADDVVHSFHLLAESPSRWLTEDIECVEALHDHAVRFRLRQPNRFFLHIVSSVHAVVLPSDVPVDEQRPVGTGAFRIVHHDEERLVMEAFDDHFQERALLDRVEYYFLPKGTPIQYAFEIEAAQDAGEGEFRFFEDGCRFVLFNMTRPGPALDEHFRQAVHLLLDRERLVRELQGTRFEAAGSFLIERSRVAPFAAGSLEEARACLERSSYRGEEVRVFFFDMRESWEDAEWLLARAREVGIEMTLHAFPLHEMNDPQIERKCDLLLMGEIFEMDRELSIVQFFRDEAGYPRRMLAPAHLDLVDEHLASFIAAPTREERMAVFVELESRLAAQHVLLPNYHVWKKSRYRSALQGLEMDAYGPPNYKKLWIRK